MQSEKSAGGGGTKIDPQDFADKIRALPVRGGVDHEWHVFYDETKPASLYGGTWEELAQGTFLMAAGSAGTAGNKGGSNTHLHERGTLVALFNTTDHDRMVRVNEETDLYGIDKTADYGYWYTIENPGTWTYREATRVGGSTASASNLPPYSTAHIWRRTS